MTPDEDSGSSGEPWPTQPLFDVPQPDGTSVTLDFTTPGPFGDLAFTAHIPDPDGYVGERVYGAYYTEEAPIFVEILQHWARVAEPDDILAGLERADAVLRVLTADAEPTTSSQNNFDDYLTTGIEPLATMNLLPGDHEHSDERGDTITLAPRGADLVWISHRDPRTAFSVPPSHLWVFVAGMMWRTYTTTASRSPGSTRLRTRWRSTGSAKPSSVASGPPPVNRPSESTHHVSKQHSQRTLALH